MQVLCALLTQDSPPAGNRKRRIARGITFQSITYPGGTPYCPGWGRGYPILTWLGGGYPSCSGWGVPHLVLARGIPYPDLAREYPAMGYPPGQDWVPPGKVPRASHWGTYPRKDMGPVKILWHGHGVPFLEPMEVLWDGDGVTPSPQEWTNWKHNLPS